MAIMKYDFHNFIGTIMEKTNGQAYKKMCDIRLKIYRPVGNDTNVYETIYISKLKLIFDKRRAKIRVIIAYNKSRTSDITYRRIIDLRDDALIEFS